MTYFDVRVKRADGARVLRRVSARSSVDARQQVERYYRPIERVVVLSVDQVEALVTAL